ncbi:hypothetical protein, partial [Desulfovibrio litoralis]
EYSLRTFNLLKRKLPLGLFLLILNSIIYPITVLYFFIQQQAYLSDLSLPDLSLLDKISLLPQLATIILSPCIIYFLLQHKKMHTLICLAVLASYEILIVVNNMFSIDIYLTPDIFFYFIPFMFIYYIKTSKEAEAYFLSNSKNKETS